MLEAKGFLHKLFWRKMDSYRDVILWFTRDIPPFGSAELTCVGVANVKSLLVGSIA